jgi:hypothetical protein
MVAAQSVETVPAVTVRSLYEAIERAQRGWRLRPQGYEEIQAARRSYEAHGESIRQRLPFATVPAYAYCGGSQTATNHGGDHIVVEQAVKIGRLKREQGDALCKPGRKFWGLERRPGERANCLRCLEIAERLTARMEGL